MRCRCPPAADQGLLVGGAGSSAAPSHSGGRKRVLTESQREAAVAAMSARRQPVDDTRQTKQVSNTDYPYDDGVKRRLHKGATQRWAEVIGPDKKRVTRASALHIDTPQRNAPDEHSFAREVYERAKVMQPRTEDKLATVRDIVEMEFKAAGRRTGAETANLPPLPGAAASSGAAGSAAPPQNRRGRPGSADFKPVGRQ